MPLILHQPRVRGAAEPQPDRGRLCPQLPAGAAKRRRAGQRNTGRCTGGGRAAAASPRLPCPAGGAAAPPPPPPAAPACGADTDRLLAELGLAANEIDELRRAGALA